jgi:hypothetical protein
MKPSIVDMQKSINTLMAENAELKAYKQEYNSCKQSLNRISTRLRKLCIRLTPSTETAVEMQKLANEIREHLKKVVY